MSRQTLTVGMLVFGSDKAESRNTNLIELKGWKEKGVSKEYVAPLESGAVAVCFAAYFVNYESAFESTNCRVTEMMVDLFGKKKIFCNSFLNKDEQVKNEILLIMRTGARKNRGLRCGGADEKSSERFYATFIPIKQEKISPTTSRQVCALQGNRRAINTQVV